MTMSFKKHFTKTFNYIEGEAHGDEDANTTVSMSGVNQAESQVSAIGIKFHTI